MNVYYILYMLKVQEKEKKIHLIICVNPTREYHVLKLMFDNAR